MWPQNWVGDASIIHCDGSSSTLSGTVLEMLKGRRVEWLVSSRARDLALCSNESMIDLTHITYTLLLRQKVAANMSLLVQGCKSRGQARALDR